MGFNSSKWIHVGAIFPEKKIRIPTNVMLGHAKVKIHLLERHI